MVPDRETGIAEPRIDRSLTLHLRGDSGIAGLHRICGWISSQVLPRCGPKTQLAIWTSNPGFRDNVVAVADRSVDISVVTPAAFAEMARIGKGPFDGEPLPNLRSLGSVPQTDRLVFGIRRDLGITTFAELRDYRPPLRIAAEHDERDNFVGWAVRRLMEASGIPESTLREWGGKYVMPDARRPRAVSAIFPGRWIELVATGAADGVIHEGISVETWQSVAEHPGLDFLPVEPDVSVRLRSELGWETVEVAPGYFPGQSNALPAMDFADFVVLCRDDLPEDVAYLVAWCMAETREVLERQYRHMSPNRSPVTYPLVPVSMGTTALPLHAGALAYYEQLPGWRSSS